MDIQNTTPLVTIITPTYNRAPLLAETIESVIAQDYPNIEYLLLDDGSTDHTRELATAFQQRFPGRIDYRFHENKGEAETVNDGWRNAKGDFVMVINSDDPQPPTLVRRSVEVMLQDPAILVTYPDWIMTDIDGKKCWRNTLKNYGFEHMVRFAHCFIGPGALINRKALAGRMTQLRNKHFPIASDVECWLEIGLLGKFRHIPEPLAVWRSHNGTTTHQHYVDIARTCMNIIDAFFQRCDLPASIRRHEKQARVSAECLLAYREFKRSPLKGLQRGLRLALQSPYETACFLKAYGGMRISQKLHREK
jgi:glycosyltransferase involved in cell wall biosynthesis